VIRDVAYSQKELASFKAVFEDAIASLSPMMVTTCNRLQVAQSILACAANGERDPIELRLAALAKLTVAGKRSHRSLLEKLVGKVPRIRQIRGTRCDRPALRPMVERVPSSGHISVRVVDAGAADSN
jgi:hypothetical protein